METIGTLLMVLGIGFILWMLYTKIKKNPAAFSAKNLEKSFFTLGILALLLIAVIVGLVLLLKI
jgi:hypothetical protein